MDRRNFFQMAAGAAGASLLGSRAVSKEVIVWKAMAMHAKGESYKKWAWLGEQLDQRTGGRIKLELTTVEELGLTGSEVLRVLRTGLVDIAEANVSYVASDLPILEATEIPGLASSYDKGKQILATWMDQVVRPLEPQIGAKVLSNFAWNSAYLFTREPLQSLDSLRGQKIRVYSPGLAAYVEALGAEPISMPISEVYSALQRGVMDGLLTGADQITAMQLWDVTPAITDLNLAPFGAYIVIGQKSYNALPADLKEIVDGLSQELTDEGWKLGDANNQVGLSAAREHGMSVVIPAPQEWQPELTAAAQKHVLPMWQSRVGESAVQSFNEILGPLSGVTIN
jgi:TRAP-type C4-dicarboxylate transport system substrate-binding protein